MQMCAASPLAALMFVNQDVCHFFAGSAWAALEYPDADVRCITFGSPRVANKVFGKAFNALVGTSLRLVLGFDPVPALPPSMM